MHILEISGKTKESSLMEPALHKLGGRRHMILVVTKNQLKHEKFPTNIRNYSGE